MALQGPGRPPAWLAAWQAARRQGRATSAWLLVPPAMPICHMYRKLQGPKSPEQACGVVTVRGIPCTTVGGRGIPYKIWTYSIFEFQ